MRKPLHDAEFDELRELLREARPEAVVPPRLAEGVWRRLDRRRRQEAESLPTWLRLALIWRKPQWVMACLVAVAFAGSVLGVVQGRQMAREEAKMRYLERVAPVIVR